MRNLDRYKKDLHQLLSTGATLHDAMQRECFPEETERKYAEQLGDKAKELLESLPSFAEEYQSWYSEAKALIRQLLPDRLADFVCHYEKPKPRKDITFESYRIEDYLVGLSVSRDGQQLVGPYAAIPHFRQQLAILKSLRGRFRSSLFDIRALVQADFFDTELEGARELARSGFLRAAGMIAGVVIERHLAEVCIAHDISVPKRRRTISDLNNLLKDASVLDTPEWRQVQRLADVRNVCAHNTGREPTGDEISELVGGADKLCKTLF